MKPIVNEPGSTASPVALTILRYALTTIGGVLAAKGLMSSDTANTLVATGLVVIPALYGGWASYRNAKALKAAAPMVPDRIINSRPDT